MNQSPDEQLNRLLQDWAESRAVSTENLASLQRKVQEQLAMAPLRTAGPSPVEANSTRSNRRFAAALLALAAALLIALVGWQSFLRPVDRVADASDQPPLPAALALADRTQVLSEYQDVFGPDLAWLVEQPSRTEVGLRRSADRAGAGPDEYVAIRLMLFARPTSEKAWQEVQTLNVVARREEIVEVLAGAEQKASLVMWAYPLDKEMISIDVRYDPGKFAADSALPREVTVESSCVQHLGKPEAVYSFERDGVEYRLYQSADLISGKDVG